MYPRLLIDTDKIAKNVRAVTGLCVEHGIEVCGVTKGVAGSARIARAFAENGVASLGDSRLQDLEQLQDIDIPKVLIRSPQLSDVEACVQLADASVNTELATLEALEQACETTGVNEHGILLMCDLGDLREGFLDEKELLRAADFVMGSRHLHLIGVGANLNCLSFILPDKEKMDELVAIARKLEERTGAALQVSGGNSTNLHMLVTEGIPEGVNALRLGESLLFGRERATYAYLPGTHNDAFILQATIIELKDKPSKPWGTAGADSYGHYHEFPDRGIRKRAIVAFGHQDTEAEVMWPLDEGIQIVDSSSDHTVLDLTEAEGDYHVGDVVEFRCGYHAVARAFISPYVEKVYL